MADVDAIDKLVIARNLLKTSLESSRVLTSHLGNCSQRLNGTGQRLQSLESEMRSNPVQKCAFFAIKDHIDRAIGPALAVVKVYDSIRDLEKSLLAESCSPLSAYLLVVKQLEEALKFLSANCGLASQWLEAILHFMKDNTVINEHYFFCINKALRILSEVQVREKRACLGGGLLFLALDKLEIRFEQLLTEYSVPTALALVSESFQKQDCDVQSPLPVAVIEQLRVIVGRIGANNRLQNCFTTYVEIRSKNAKTSLKTLDLDYLQKSITDSDDVQDIDGFIDQWCQHFKLAVKHVFAVEFKLCSDIFEKLGSNLWMSSFVEIAVQSGIVCFLNFGVNITKCKKDPMKLLKLLDVFEFLHHMRVDFNRLFGGESCSKIQTLTRDLIKRVVDGAWEIFFELPLQVKLQRQSIPPADGSVPKLVSFVTDYSNYLIGDHYKPLLCQIILIRQSWEHAEHEEGILTAQIYNIMKEIAQNLDTWSKAHRDVALYYVFMMNNHCHFSNLKGTKLGDMMGESWLRAHQQYTDYYMTHYTRECWGRILASIREESQIYNSPKRGFCNDLVKKRLRRFNEAFDEMYVRHSKWVVPDEKLRLRICKLLVLAFIPVYRIYLQNIGILAENDASPSRYVKYTTEGLESMLSSLFQPQLMKCSTTKQTHFIQRLKCMVTDHLLLTLAAV
ncbi:hypothetical protein K2173_016784 [Erythroxylum novogranatense]|uniref:Exocyst subunit Exo70 family protein n=1 Tax=Erythroxylum novogranatense TaxID=1862640 RepID=A0AAV8SS14_9ROSI|nr:hypothetical protein K2173_016784 [Erythroxylum novogranatense]